MLLTSQRKGPQSMFIPSNDSLRNAVADLLDAVRIVDRIGMQFPAAAVAANQAAALIEEAMGELEART